MKALCGMLCLVLLQASTSAAQTSVQERIQTARAFHSRLAFSPGPLAYFLKIRELRARAKPAAPHPLDADGDGRITLRDIVQDYSSAAFVQVWDYARKLECLGHMKADARGREQILQLAVRRQKAVTNSGDRVEALGLPEIGNFLFLNEINFCRDAQEAPTLPSIAEGVDSAFLDSFRRVGGPGETPRGTRLVGLLATLIQDFSAPSSMAQAERLAEIKLIRRVQSFYMDVVFIATHRKQLGAVADQFSKKVVSSPSSILSYGVVLDLSTLLSCAEQYLAALVSFDDLKELRNLRHDLAEFGRKDMSDLLVDFPGAEFIPFSQNYQALLPLVQAELGFRIWLRIPQAPPLALLDPSGDGSFDFGDLSLWQEGFAAWQELNFSIPSEADLNALFSDSLLQSWKRPARTDFSADVILSRGKEQIAKQYDAVDVRNTLKNMPADQLFLDPWLSLHDHASISREQDRLKSDVDQLRSQNASTQAILQARAKFLTFEIMILIPSRDHANRADALSAAEVREYVQGLAAVRDAKARHETPDPRTVALNTIYGERQAQTDRNMFNTDLGMDQPQVKEFYRTMASLSDAPFLGLDTDQRDGLSQEDFQLLKMIVEARGSRETKEK